MSQDLQEQIDALSRKIADMANKGPLTPDDQGVTLFDDAGTFIGRVAALQEGTNVTLSKSGKYGVITGAAGGSGGAPTDATYITLSTSSSLSAERVLTEGANIYMDTTVAGALTLSTRIREVYYSLGDLTGVTI